MRFKDTRTFKDYNCNSRLASLDQSILFVMLPLIFPVVILQRFYCFPCRTIGKNSKTNKLRSDKKILCRFFHFFFLNNKDLFNALLQICKVYAANAYKFSMAASSRRNGCLNQTITKNIPKINVIAHRNLEIIE